ncbi:hypothetical protein Tco_1039743 [Tanacetum coccineum]
MSKKRRKPSPSTKSRNSLPSWSSSVFFRLRHRDSEPSHRENSVGTDVFTRLGAKERIVFTRLEPDVFSRLGSKDRPHQEERSDSKSCGYVGACPGSRDPERRRRESRSLIQSYITYSSERQRKIEKEWNEADRENRRTLTPVREVTLSESKNSVNVSPKLNRSLQPAKGDSQLV